MGDVYIDEMGDRIADYTLLDMTDIENGIWSVCFCVSLLFPYD